MAVATGLFVLALAATTALILLVTDDSRGFMTWITLLFLCTMEMVALLMIVAPMVDSGRTEKPSGAAVAISWGVLATYFLVGVVCIIFYGLARDPKNPHDVGFSAILGFLAVVAFIIAQFIRAYDLFFQAGTQEALVRRESHVVKARTLKSLLARMRQVNWQPEALGRVEKILKRIERVETALAHSHGGGMGSFEQVTQHADDPALDSQINELLATLAQTVSQMETDKGSVEANLGLAEATVTSLAEICRALRIE
jgi:hypothetical protein